MQYDLETGSHTVHALQYYLLTVTKYRSGLLADAHLSRFREIAHNVAGDYGCDVSDINSGPDHVHLLFRANPTTDLIGFVNHLKGLSSRRLREEFDGLKRGLSALWQPGYFLCTTGQVTLADLQEYVENQ